MKRLLLVMCLFLPTLSFAEQVGGWIYRNDENVSNGKWRSQYTTAPKINYNHVDAGYNFFTSSFGTKYEANLRIAYSDKPNDWDEESELEVRPYLTAQLYWRMSTTTVVSYKNYFEWIYNTAAPNSVRYQGQLIYTKTKGNFSPYVSGRFAYDEYDRFDGTDAELGITYKLIESTSFNFYIRHSMDNGFATRYNMIAAGMYRKF